MQQLGWFGLCEIVQGTSDFRNKFSVRKDARPIKGQVRDKRGGLWITQGMPVSSQQTSPTQRTHGLRRRTQISHVLDADVQRPSQSH